MNFWDDARLLQGLARFLTVLVLLAGIVTAVYWLMQRPYFMLKQIRVETRNQSGLRFVNVPAIRANAMPRLQEALQKNFFMVDLVAVRQAIENVPWVRRAEVRRVWPNGLLVKIEEHQALASWGETALVNIFGEVFTANRDEAEQDGQLPELAGPSGSSAQVTARYLDLKNSLKPVRLQIRQLSLSARYAWRATLANGMVLEMGRERTDMDVASRVRRFVEIYPQLQKNFSPHFDYVDLRYPNGFAVRSSAIKLAS